jgi:hypothetical protein
MDTYVFGENLKPHGGEAVLSSVNAPRANQIPWDRDACTVAGEHKHSGELGCQVEVGQALVWPIGCHPAIGAKNLESRTRGILGGLDLVDARSIVEVVARRSGHAEDMEVSSRDHSRCPIRIAFERQNRFHLRT